MIECPNCKNLNEEENQFCGKCGAKLPDAKYCPKGHYHSYNDDYCTKCGTKLVSKAEYEKLSRNVFSLLQKASDLEKNEKFDESLQCLDEILEIDPNNIDCLNFKRRIYENLGKYDEAIEYCDKRIKLDSNDNFAFLYKGKYLSELGKFDEAIECYDESLLINPNYYSPYIDKGFSLLELNRLDEALNCFDKALNINNDPFYWDYIVGKLIQFFKLEEALNYCNRGLNFHPNDISLNFNKAKLSCLTGNEMESDEIISKFGLRESRLFYEVARYFNAIDEFHKALRYCSKSIHLDSKDPYSLALMGNIYFNIKQYDLSLNYFKKALELSSNNEEYINLSKYCQEFIQSNLSETKW